MQFSYKSLALVFAATTTVVAEKQLQLNYYSDASCKNHGGHVDVTWANSLGSGRKNCYNYQYGNSVLIAECNKGGGCLCNFHPDKDCKGSYQQSTSRVQECVNSIGSYKSFECYYR